MRTHTGETPFKCTECEKTFKRSDKLKQHQRNHTGEILAFHCNLCDKSFERQDYFKRHQMIHTEQRPFPCDECQKSFRQVGNLKRHKLIHSGENPLSCQECEKSFNQATNLKRHLAKHSGEKAFKCENCAKSFARKDKLRKHNGTHTKGKFTKPDGSHKIFEKRDKLQAFDKSFMESENLTYYEKSRTKYPPRKEVSSKDKKTSLAFYKQEPLIWNEKEFSDDSTHAADQESETKFKDIEVNFLCNFCDSVFLERETLDWHQIFCRMIKL